MAPAILPLFAAIIYPSPIFFAMFFSRVTRAGGFPFAGSSLARNVRLANTSGTRAESLVAARCALTSSPTGMSGGLIASEMPFKGKHRKEHRPLERWASARFCRMGLAGLGEELTSSTNILWG